MPRVAKQGRQDGPGERRPLASGRHLTGPAGEVLALTAEEEAGLEEALASMDTEQGLTLEEVRDSIRAELKR